MRTLIACDRHASPSRRVRNRCLRFAALCTLAILSCGSPVAVQAETRSLGPASGTAQHGFTMDVRIDSVPGSGYQPVALRFRPQGKAFTRERRLTVRIWPMDYAITEIDYSYETQVTLPEKANTASKVCLIPYYYAWHEVGVQVLEDGRPLKDCLWTFGFHSSRQLPLPHTKIGVVVLPGIANNSAPETLAAWEICPDIRSLQTTFKGPLPEDTSTMRLSHTAALAELKRVQPGKVQFRTLPFDELYDSWLGYSQLDIVLVAAPFLQRLESMPQQYTALTDWVASGGNLWVYAPQQSESSLLDAVPFSNISSSIVLESQTLDKTLRLEQANDTNEWQYSRWGEPEKIESYDTTTNLSDQIYTLNTQTGKPQSSRQEIYDKLDKDNHPFVAKRESNEVTRLIRTANFGLGEIIVIDSEAPFPESHQLWSTVYNATKSERPQWKNETSRKVDQGSRTYWNFLLESVGQPPVKTFIILNTLFVLLIGPFFYFYLRRKERLFLLFFIAPAAATLVTLGIGVYALLADGMQTRGRVHQLTWVDPHSNYLSTQSRQTYYAVLNSRDGLEYDNQTAIYPVLSRDIHQTYRSHSQPSQNVPQRLIHQNNTTRYRGVFLPPRSQSQLLAIKPNQLAETLTMQMDETTFKVTNHFPFDLHQFTARDNSGRLWRAAEPLATGATTSLHKITNEEYSLPLMESDPLSGSPTANPPYWRQSAGQSGETDLEIEWAIWLKRLPDNHFFAVRNDIETEILGAQNVDWQDYLNILMGPLP